MSRARWAAAASLLLVLSCVSALATSEEIRATPGRDALQGLDGGTLTADHLDQGTTLLVVWASWSPRCRDIAKRIDRLVETWSDDARVASVVFQEKPETVREFLADGCPRAPVYLDLSGEFCKRHAVTTLPMLLIFRDGELAFRGKLSANPDPVIERVLGQNSN